MTSRIGIAIAHDAIRAVVVHRGTVTWAAEARRELEESLSGGIEAILREAPISRLRRFAVAAAVGPHAAQVKQVAGLPPVADAATLASVIRESASSFFLRNGSPLMTTDVRPAGEGVAWAAAIETRTFEAVRDACRAVRFKLASVVPSVVVLPFGFTNEMLTWRDGELAVEIRRSAAGLEAVRRRPAALVDVAPLTPVAELAVLGERAHRFADAFGAAVMPADEELSVGPTGSTGRRTHALARALVFPGAVSAIAIVSLLLSPLSAVWSARRAESSLRELHASERWQVMETALEELGPVTAALDEVEAFAASRPERTRMLGELTRMLPDGSALLRVEIQGEEGHLVAVTSQVAELTAAVSRISGVRSAEVVGPVRSEAFGARELNRVTIAFRMAGPDSAGTR